jgi:hypothetical protein
MRGRLVSLLSAVLTTVVLLAAVPAAIAVSAPDVNLVAARAAAEQILALTPLPPGATAQSTDQSTNEALTHVVPFRGGQLVDRHQYWTLSESPSSVSDYVWLYPPAGSQYSGLEIGGFPPYFWSEIRTFPGATGRLSSEMLQVSVAAAPGGGTAVRADAEVIWRPSWEQIPASSRAAKVQLDGVAQRTVRGMGTARLRELVDADSVVGPGGYSCPAGVQGQVVTVTFVDARARPVARVTYNSADGCDFMGISVRGRRGPELWGGASLVQRLWSLGALARCTSGQLTVSVGRPSDAAGGDSATISVRNIARTPCTLKGYPSVELLSAAGRRLSSTDTGESSSAEVSTLPAGTKLVSALFWSPQPKRCSKASATSTVVRLPGIAHPF